MITDPKAIAVLFFMIGLLVGCYLSFLIYIIFSMGPK